MNKNVEFHPLEEHTGKTSASYLLALRHLMSKKGQIHRQKSYLNTFLWSVLKLTLNSETENPDIQ